MEKVPEMISTKDLDYISDIFNWNFNASKLLNHFLMEVMDEEIKNYFEEIRDMHTNICQHLVNILEDSEGGNTNE